MLPLMVDQRKVLRLEEDEMQRVARKKKKLVREVCLVKWSVCFGVS